MRVLGRLMSCLVGASLLSFGLLAVSPMTAAAAAPYTCSGTLKPFNPGLLVGTHSDVRVSGLCGVFGGDATVKGDLTVRAGGSLVAAFGLNDTTGTGSSTLTVKGDIKVQDGGSLILGCIPSSFPCFDDPNMNAPTLSSHAKVSGDLTSDEPLGVVVHNTSVGGDVKEKGGGGGFKCAPAGVFPGPVYSDYEDSSIKGDVSVTGLTSCWMGLARLKVGGDMRLINNQLADPDAIEILSNHISGDLVCRGNSMVWDSAEAGFPGLFPRIPLPNTVKDDRVGQCVLSSPTTQGGPVGPGPF